MPVYIQLAHAFGTTLLMVIIIIKYFSSKIFINFILKEAVQLDGKTKQCIALLVYLVYQFNNKNTKISLYII